ncbi:hypothetical protein O1611_g2098 [Lasiodiplodia mahajangana]|uniref:Uncharacterized protein n=1 Tax=Lasiodiplodia mahajangana TaxID=1108764 RepID=A0ACC2JW82_9PEZI|nr:hypothetical protein O1611_g2098 [Lasiodiplodia mahajangana]
MDEADRRDMLAQQALPAPDGVEVNLVDPPNMNALANSILIAAIILSSLAVLVRIHSWVFVLKQFKDRLEAVLIIIGFWVYIAGLLYNSGIAPVKVAILVEWMRVLSPRSRDAFFWLCQAGLWLNVVYYIAAIIVESMQCTPRDRIWDPTVNGKCLDVRALEVITSINVVSDTIMLAAPQFVIWRLKLSKGKIAGLVLISAIGLFGTISAIFRLVAAQEYLRSEDSTYLVTPVCFWALGEMTSAFIVYGLPAASPAFADAATRFPRYHMRWTQGFTMGGMGGEAKASNIGPWREGRNGPSKRYKNLDRNSLPVNALDTLDTTTTQCTSTIADVESSRLRESRCVVVKTVEIRRDEIRTDALGDLDKDIEDDVMLRQHPWVKLGQEKR